MRVFIENWSSSPVTWYIASALVLLSLTSLIRARKSRDTRKVKRPPPGPKGYPIFGTFPSFLKKPAHLVIKDWTEKYGNVFRYQLGPGECVVLGDRETIREAFVTNSPDVDSRCQWRDCFISMFKGLSVLPYCEKWSNTRRRTLTILRDFGMGKGYMEDKIYEENQYLIECILDAGEDGKKNFDPRDMLRRSPMNTIYSIMFGKRYDYDNPKLLMLMNTIAYLVDTCAIASVYDILPAPLRPLAGFSMNHFRQKLDELSSYMHEQVEKHRKYYKTKATRDFVDAWLKANDEDQKKLLMSSHNNNNNCCNGEGIREPKPYGKLPDVIQDVLVAGAHSTGLVLNWMVLLMVINKHEQDLAYEEIMEVIGPDRVPSMSDRPRLRRVDAIVHESLRISTVLPLVAHATCRDTVIGGFDVKSNTEVMYNNWTINRDKKYFPEPEKFNPGRWIDAEGKLRKDLLQNYFPFGIGKRSCAGEALARMDLFISIATLLQNIEMLPPDETVQPSMKPEVVHVVGLLAECKPYMMKVRKRPTYIKSK